jgi:hypothetical protein
MLAPALFAEKVGGLGEALAELGRKMRGPGEGLEELHESFIAELHNTGVVQRGAFTTVEVVYKAVAVSCSLQKEMLFASSGTYEEFCVSKESMGADTAGIIANRVEKGWGVPEKIFGIKPTGKYDMGEVDALVQVRGGEYLLSGMITFLNLDHFSACLRLPGDAGWGEYDGLLNAGKVVPASPQHVSACAERASVFLFVRQ